MGSKDEPTSVIQSFKGSESLAPGVSVSPGKPTSMARVHEKAIFGLPGHPVSAMIIFTLLVRPLSETMGGLEIDRRASLRVRKAKMSRNLASAPGREDYIRVRLEQEGEILWAHPVLGKSGMISTMVKADGMIKIDQHLEGLERGSDVDVILIS